MKGFGCRPVDDLSAVLRAGVRKPPGKEPAGARRAVCRLWGFDGAAAWREGCAGRRSRRRIDDHVGERCRRGCPRRGDFGMIGGIASAFAGTGATVVRRRKRRSPAGGWCDEAVTVVMASRS